MQALVLATGLETGLTLTNLALVVNLVAADLVALVQLVAANLVSAVQLIAASVLETLVAANVLQSVVLIATDVLQTQVAALSQRVEVREQLVDLNQWALREVHVELRYRQRSRCWQGGNQFADIAQVIHDDPLEK